MKTYTSATLLILSTLSCFSCEDRWVWDNSRSGKSSRANSNFNDISLRGEQSIAQPVVADYNRNRKKNQNQQSDDPGLFNPSEDNRNYQNGPQRRPQSRYEVEESLNSGLITIQPSRPFPNQAGGGNGGIISLPPRPIPGPIPLPQNQRPGERFPENPNFRPNGPPPPPGNLVPAQSRPGGAIAGPPPSVGILTGPVPSWEKGPLNKNGDPTSFQNCKCAHSFNCKAPGIQFGKCDEGKQYCCFNDLNTPNKKAAGGSPIRGGDSEGFGSEPFILTGPSSPGGHYGASRPGRPYKNEPGQGFVGGPRDYDEFEAPSRYQSRAGRRS